MIENVMFRRNKVKCLSGEVRAMLNQDELKSFYLNLEDLAQMLQNLFPLGMDANSKNCSRRFLFIGQQQSSRVGAAM